MDVLRLELPDGWGKDGELAISRAAPNAQSLRIAEIHADSSEIPYDGQFYIIRETLVGTEIVAKENDETAAKLRMLEEARS